MRISFSETHTNTLCSRQFKTINTMISSFQRTKSHPLGCLRVIPSKLNKVSCVQVSVRLSVCFLRKEVIQPQVLLRLPCYDFTLIICPTLDGSLPKRVTPPASGVTNSWCDGRCVQGPGTYSPRRADPRLLAIPTSCRRVAAYSPN